MLMTETREEIEARALEVMRQRVGGEIVGNRLVPLADYMPAPPAASSVPDVERRWYVVQSEPRQDRIATAGLIGRGFAAYAPLVARDIRQGRGRTREVIRAMFPGYVFVHLSLATDRWQRIFSTAGVRGMLMAGDRPAIVPDDKLDLVRTVEKDEEQYRQSRIGGHDFTVGQQVKIVEGPFCGFVAAITDLDDAGRIGALLSIFGGPTRTVMSADQIEAL